MFSHNPSGRTSGHQTLLQISMNRWQPDGCDSISSYLIICFHWHMARHQLYYYYYGDQMSLKVACLPSGAVEKHPFDPCLHVRMPGVSYLRISSGVTDIKWWWGCLNYAKFTNYMQSNDSWNHRLRADSKIVSAQRTQPISFKSLLF